GHAMAAGLRLASDRLEQFREKLVSRINELLPAERLTGCIEIDAECCLRDLDMGLLAEIERMAPFGRDNPSPTLCARRVALSIAAQRVGREGKHLRLQLRQDGVFVPAVAFGMGDLAPHLPGGLELDLVFTLQRSTWQGRQRLDVMVQDLRPAAVSAAAINAVVG